MTALLCLLALSVVPSPPVDASATRRGLVNTSAQSFSGAKTFDGGVVTDLLTGSTYKTFEILAATSAAMTLYVDPTGSDSNACTATGAAACLTVGGALAKVPRFLKHNVTINVAAGAYAAAITGLAGFNVPTGIVLAITGTMSAFAPATGTASGTTTNSAAPSNATGPAVLTDSGQSWTVNDLRGAFVTVAGVSYPIVSNTATTITYPGTGAAGTGVAYSVATPGSTFISTAATAFEFEGNGAVQFSNLRIERTSGGSALTASSGSGSVFVYFINCDARAAGSSNAALTVFSGNIRLTRSYFYAASGVAVSLTGALASSWSSSFIRSGTTSAVNLGGSQSTNASLSSVAFEGVGTSTPVVSISGSKSVTVTGWIACTGGGAGIGFNSLATANTGAAAFSLLFQGRVASCATGVQVPANSVAKVTAGGVTVDTATDAFSVSHGGKIHFSSTTPTFTTVTNELSLDGTAYTFASLVAASPQVLSDVYGSTLIR